jgi:hypothetical protein
MEKLPNELNKTKCIVKRLQQQLRREINSQGRHPLKLNMKTLRLVSKPKEEVKDSRFYHKEVEEVRQYYREKVWHSFGDFKRELLAAMNDRFDVYYAKKCAKNIYVKCSKCNSFELRYTLERGKFNSKRSLFCKGISYHSGQRH